MVGKLLSWDGSVGKILNVDEGDTVLNVAVADTVGSLTQGDLVTFAVGWTENSPRCVSVTKKE